MNAIGLLVVIAICATTAAVADPPLGGLICPCEVTSFDIYLDGGTLGGRIVDANGISWGFCLDGRMQVMSSAADEEHVPPKPRAFFLGAEHPDHLGARPLDIYGDEELSLLAALHSWVERVLPLDQFKTARSEYRACTNAQQRQDLLRSHEFTDEQARALWIDSVVQWRRESILKAGKHE
ncbi:MAG: hypothetical protein IPK64_18080 [bacterium]|nr:hypothetical protein [bacterium]MBK8167858.1 hypothetical protein [bacterium]